MAYYNHEAFPWPRQSVMEHNEYHPYEDGYADPRDFYQAGNSRFTYNPGSDFGPQGNSSQQVPPKWQGSKQKEKTDWKAIRAAKVMKKSVMEGISRPVESSKAERMMQMMGWQGGALGKTGTGLKEPLAPNLMLQSGAGLGHKTEEKIKPLPKKQAKKAIETIERSQKKEARKAIETNGWQQKKEAKKAIETNGWQQKKRPKKEKTNDRDDQSEVQRVRKFKPKRGRRMQSNCPIRLQILTDLLDFVKDNNRIEMRYDPSLSDKRRKVIHTIVETVREEDVTSDTRSLMHPSLYTVFAEICLCNDYVLQSQSDGERPFRQICVFKEAPAHVFLIIKEDLEEEVEKPEDQSCEKKVDVVPENEINIVQNKVQNDDTITSCEADITVIKQDHDEDKTADTTTNNTNTVDTVDENTPNVPDSDENDPSLKTEPKTEDLENIEVKIEHDNEVKAEYVEQNRHEVVRALLKKYLEEFFAAAEYTEMRFLGEFSEIEQAVIGDFMANIKECLCDVVAEENWLFDTVLDHKYTVQFDNNGGELIVKC